VRAELGEEPYGRGVLAPRRGPLRGVQCGLCASDEIHPYAVEAIDEVGIDMEEQYPKELRTYMGKVGFKYLIIVCARAEKDCPKTFPGVGMRFVWVFDDPRGEDVTEGEMLETFRQVRDEIEAKILYWLEYPEEEFREQRDRERLLREGLFRDA
jgi:arsenate reductase (thioredoxin)